MTDEMKKHVDKTKLKRDQEYYNACWKEHNLSLKCLDKNKYDYDKCMLYFNNYKSCKKFWANVYSERRTKGITPFMPSPEEREKIKAEYLASRKR
ncbi:coiled-coil-helix-coiled-coil-helix domain-containing protein 7 [Megachile rotundata]|uniref:coiled-coil-helix-coiled-coil-helix domain-containing protein 7 n=1 Tax=Megachile rotundata TaxID=143995 RepID=UPI000258DD2D|nr:PREDICTED: coiled-coil-helix-coiled-coil-helix domain-containing protein 7 [Megachile rotundata]XP_012135715.1 PREDICTED: coiled-coil-helix-coiled-coil-helix domain-containing protein 7 [Megachile rotundata]XP_012135716.1 PREDICTED: coiled-coil-helix-coiled-coil-helix domain-containing protein 7 [Megachile rotundata]